MGAWIAITTVCQWVSWIYHHFIPYTVWTNERPFHNNTTGSAAFTTTSPRTVYDQMRDHYHSGGADAVAFLSLIAANLAKRSHNPAEANNNSSSTHSLHRVYWMIEERERLLAIKNNSLYYWNIRKNTHSLVHHFYVLI